MYSRVVPDDAWETFDKAYQDGLAERLLAKAARLKAIREAKERSGSRLGKQGPTTGG